MNISIGKQLRGHRPRSPSGDAWQLLRLTIFDMFEYMGIPSFMARRCLTSRSQPNS